MRFGLRRVALFAFFLPAAALFNCVGDDPGTVAPTEDGGETTDGSTDGAVPGDAATSDVTPADAGPTDPCPGVTGCPNKIELAHLQLWLRSDLSLDCTGGHVATWHDLSGHAGRDAKPALYLDGGTAVAPLCGTDTINSRPAVTFDQPDAGPAPPHLDGTMSVDLSFLVSTSYTIFVVHQPVYRNTPTGFGQTQGLLAADRSSQFSSCTPCSGTCPPPAQNDGTLDLTINAYVDASSPLLFYNETSTYCGGPWFSGSYVDKSTDLHVVVFDTVNGHTLLANGETIFVGDKGAADLTAIIDDGLRPAAIGREKNSYADDRYKGKISEIIVYDTALSSVEVNSVTQYLYATWNLP